MIWTLELMINLKSYKGNSDDKIKNKSVLLVAREFSINF
jgi:hypothetical protein